MTVFIDQERNEWQEHAACRGRVDDMFPARGTNGDGIAKAKAICAGCIVTADCLDYALRHNERYGVWGGMSGKELRRARRAWVAAQPKSVAVPVERRAVEPARHGTSSKYVTGCRCGDCTVANSAYVAEYRRRKSRDLYGLWDAS